MPMAMGIQVFDLNKGFILSMAPLLLLLLMLWRFVPCRKKLLLPLPPGPTPLPVVGHMHMMGQMTHRGLAKLAKEHGGLVHLRLGFLHTVSVSTAYMAQQVLQVQDVVFSNRPATIAIAYLTYDRSDMAFAHYGPFWRKMRKLCVVKLFSRRRAESWASVSEETDRMVADVASRSSGAPVNVGELVFNLTKNITFRAAFGSHSHEEHNEFIAILHEFSLLFGCVNLGDFIPFLKWADLQGINRRLRNARSALDSFIDHIIDQHIANTKAPDAPDTDMVDEMLAFLDDGRLPGHQHPSAADDLHASLRLTRENIKAVIMDVMFGGTETVASAIEWAVAELMHRPEEMRRMQEELAAVVGLDRRVEERDLDRLPYLKCVVKETLRLHPPIPLLLHETAEECALAGYRVPAGSRVVVNVWAIGRDGASWKDPDVFRPARFGQGGEAEEVDFRGSSFELLPFGSGRRSCPGMQLGLYGLEMAVAQLVHCFEWALPGGMDPGELDMSDVFGLTAPRAQRLDAVPIPRLTCPL